MYYSNGVAWSFLNVPYQATQAEVDAGAVTDKFLTPETFNDSDQLLHLTPESIDFDTTPSTDPNIVGRLQWSPTEKTLEYGVEGGTIDVNKELFDYYVDTNNDLIEGNVVSVTGISGNRQAVTRTDNTDRASATACVGVVTHKNTDNTVRITKMGRVRKLNTGGMTEGLPVYANAIGGFTQTAPTAPDYFIHVGTVEVAHAVNGVIDVDIRIVYNSDDLSD